RRGDGQRSPRRPLGPVRPYGGGGVAARRGRLSRDVIPLVIPLEDDYLWAGSSLLLGGSPDSFKGGKEMAETGLTRPKGTGEGDGQERNGVVIEECVGCQGVFLDRGELERLIEAESEYLATLDIAEEAGYQGRHRKGIMHQLFAPAE